MLAGLLTAFIVPLVRQGANLADDLPGFVEDAQAGRGPVGRLIERYDLAAVGRGEPGQHPGVPVPGRHAGRSASCAASSPALIALLTILVLTFLMVASGPAPDPPGGDAHTRAAPRPGPDASAADSAQAVSGYMVGNFLISIVAGLSTWLVLVLLGVPYAGVLALWVAFADLIPLVGATLGAIPTIAFAFLHSTRPGSSP